MMDAVTLAHRELLMSLAPDFHQRGVSWCLIKWPDDDRQHGDLDILVSDGLDTAQIIAREHGLTYEHGVDRYRRKYVGTWLDEPVELDLHTDAAWVGIRYLPTEWVVRTATTRMIGGRGVPVPKPEAALLIWAAHDMRSNEITYWDVQYCHELLTECDLAECVAMAEAHGWQNQFDEFVNLVRRLHVYPQSSFPYNQPFLTSLRLKAGKVANTVRLDGFRAAVAELNTLRKFDL